MKIIQDNFLFIRSILLICWFCTFSSNILSQGEIPSAPYPPKLYNNLSNAFPNFLNKTEAIALEKKLQEFAISTSNQIVVLIVDTLNGYEPWDYATRIGDKWGVGQKKEDNGIVVLIKPTGGAGNRKTFISTGKGLEGAIPDVTCLKIVNQELIPNFKNRQFNQGINSALEVLMSLAKNEYSHQDYKSRIPNSSSTWFVIILLIIFFLLFFGFFAIFIFFIVFIIIKTIKRSGTNTIVGNGNNSSTSRWSSSFGSSSRSSSFGGFSGGSFGGGGAGGSW